MDIPGFALSADVELLRRECHNYKHSFGITDGIMHKLCVDESNPALEAAWDLIFYDSGIHSILRQEGVSNYHFEASAVISVLISSFFSLSKQNKVITPTLRRQSKSTRRICSSLKRKCPFWEEESASPQRAGKTKNTTCTKALNQHAAESLYSDFVLCCNLRVYVKLSKSLLSRD